VQLSVRSKKHGEHVIFFDEIDYDIIKNYNWHLRKNGSTFYAMTNISGSSVQMHRIITNPNTGMIIDHINHNGLDNRRCNLRICTILENNRNTVIRKDNKSGYKGVYWSKQHKMWRAYIRIDTKPRHIGLFRDSIIAAKAYNDAAIKYFGEFARVNAI
jgi:hypothetical protein